MRDACQAHGMHIPLDAVGLRLSLHDASGAPAMHLGRARTFSHVAAAGAAIAVEFEPRFFGLRDIKEKAGTFEADIGIKVCDLSRLALLLCRCMLCMQFPTTGFDSSPSSGPAWPRALEEFI